MSTIFYGYLRSCPLLLCVLLTTGLAAQSTPPPADRDLAAPLSASAMAARYFDIDFSVEQRKLLSGVEIELIMLIDTSGRASLSGVNNVSDAAIIDSLDRVTEQLPRFTPAVVEGELIESLYTLYFTLPIRSRVVYSASRTLDHEYRRLKMDDFEYLERSSQRVGLLFAGSANQFVGRPAHYLSTGGGFKMDITYVDSKAYAYGMAVALYGNYQRRPYPIVTDRELHKVPQTIQGSLLFGRHFDDRWLLQGEAGYVQHNLSPSLNNGDRNWVYTAGPTLGVVLHRSFAFGEGEFDYVYGYPSVRAGYLNLHAGLHYHHLGLREARGLMLQLGVGYRLSNFRVEAYRLKE